MISEMLFSLNDIDIDSMTYDKSDTETDTPCLGIKRTFFASSSTMFDILVAPSGWNSGNSGPESDFLVHFDRNQKKTEFEAWRNYLA